LTAAHGRAIVEQVVRAKKFSTGERNCMCRPIPGNFVRPKTDYKVRPMRGSRGVSTGKDITLPREARGMAERNVRNSPDHFIVLFEHPGMPGATIQAKMHHTQLKALEA
jgi:hypothetical protein